MKNDTHIHRGPFGRVFVHFLSDLLVEHAHSDHQLVFCLDAVQDTIRISGKDYPLNGFQGAAANEWEPHAHIRDNTDSAAFLVFYLKSEWLQDQGLFAQGQTKFRSPSFPVFGQLWSLLCEFSIHLLVETPRIDVDAYVHQAMGLTLEAMDCKSKCFKEDARSEWGADIRVQKSLDYMQENVGKRLSIDDLAREVGISRPHLFALFRKQLNITPGVFWNTLRVETAINYLQQDDMNLREIADIIGFTEPGNFSRFFRNNTGFYPSNYRAATTPDKAKTLNYS